MPQRLCWFSSYHLQRRSSKSPLIQLLEHEHIARTPIECRKLRLFYHSQDFLGLFSLFARLSLGHNQVYRKSIRNSHHM